MNYWQLKKNLELEFKESNINDFADIDWIICEVCGKKRSELIFIENFSEDELLKIHNAVALRLEHLPIAYIFGKTNFMGYDLKVSKDVLIPRLDTEILVEKLINDIKTQDKQVSILDLCTGSGAIAIVIKKETNAKVSAADISVNAIEIAKQNANLNNAEIEFFVSDLFKNLANKKFDIIVSNPPYIESRVIETLDKEVRDNEPILALDGGDDGLNFYRKIVDEADKHLNKNGKLYFEIGYNQAKDVSEMMNQKFKNIQVLKDYEGNDRVVWGELYD